MISVTTVSSDKCGLFRALLVFGISSGVKLAQQAAQLRLLCAREHAKMGIVRLRAHRLDLVPEALATFREMQGVRAELATFATRDDTDRHELVHHFHGAGPIDAQRPAQ